MWHFNQTLLTPPKKHTGKCYSGKTGQERSCLTIESLGQAPVNTNHGTQIYNDEQMCHFPKNFFLDLDWSDWLQNILLDLLQFLIWYGPSLLI